MMIWQRSLAEPLSYGKEAGMHRYLAIRRQEWVWVIIWSLIILGLTSLPALYGVLLSTPENQFSGFAIGVEDTYSYLGKMRLGAEGDWQFYLIFLGISVNFITINRNIVIF